MTLPLTPGRSVFKSEREGDKNVFSIISSCEDYVWGNNV